MTIHDQDTVGTSPSAFARATALLRPAGGPHHPGDRRGGVDGYVETLPMETTKTFSQRALDTRFTAWAYDRARDRVLRVAGMESFEVEAAAIADALRPGPGEVVLDLACGHGNFTVEWARRVGPEGLVIGVDYSVAMLRRAAARVRESGLTNIVLVHGDAQHLPLTDSSFQRVNCSGGFHAFPDLPQALREISRVSAPGATLTASTFAEAPGDKLARPKRWLNRHFALHFVPLLWLGTELDQNGFRDFEWSMRGGSFAYTSAVRCVETVMPG
jgi:ubiquinone/menaquinone biosynthesis C-methylase UbiE